jgi:hypothetical protein
MRDYAVEGRLQEDTTAAQAAPKTKPAKKAKKQKNSVYAENSSWIARVMGTAKYKGETNEEWNARLVASALK